MNYASYTNFSQMCKSRINKFLQQEHWYLGQLVSQATEKTQGDWVTYFDLEISRIIEQLILELQWPHILLSEENWSPNTFYDFHKPLIILDPIDGTKGFKNGTSSFCLSLVIMEDGQGIFSWLWNFGTQEETCTFSLHNNENNPQTLHSPLYGLVSESEWNRNLWLTASSSSVVKLKPLGSIAYKLLLLSLGQCDFVASKRPKNIWDIAGGTHAVKAKGFEFYHQERKVELLDKMHWDAPLLWCKPEHFVLLTEHLFKRP